MHFPTGRALLSTVMACSALSALIASAQTSPASSVSAKFLYSTNFNGNTVLGYSVSPSTGAIVPTTQGSMAAHTGPTRVASDKGGYRLYVVNQTSQDLSAYFIYSNDGSLHSVPNSPFAIGQTPNGVAVAPSGDYVYVTTLDSTSNPVSYVYAFAVQSDGALLPVAGSPFSTVNWAAALAIDPKGEYLYVSSSPETSTPSDAYVDAFAISPSDGALTHVSGAPFNEPDSASCANGAWDIAVHPSGKFVVLPSMCQGMLVYQIERTTGTLTLVTGSPFAEPYPSTDVESIAMDPKGEYFWVTTQYCFSGCSDGTDTWKINTTTGVPTYLEAYVAGCGLLARADPSGKYVYEVGDTASNASCGEGEPAGLWGFDVTRSTGALTDASGTPWASANSDWFLSDGLAITP